MGRFNDFDRMMVENTMVVYNGEIMTKKRRDALIRAEKRKQGIRERNAKIIPILSQRVETLKKGFKLAKSLVAYYRNGYKQWGTIHTEIVTNPYLESPFIQFIAANNDAEKVFKAIQLIAKKNDKDIYGYIEKFAYKVDDMMSGINAISDGAINAEIFSNPYYVGKEVVYGNGRRLGLKELVSRTCSNLAIMQKAMQEMLAMVNDGTDVMEYNPNTKKTITFVQG